MMQYVDHNLTIVGDGELRSELEQLVKKLNLENVNFGVGKRSLCKNGRYDSKYKIVVPK